MTATPYFVEGVHEQARPLQGDFDDVTVTLDLSPGDYFESNPFPPLAEALATIAELEAVS